MTTSLLHGIPVYKDPNCAASFDDGRPRLFTFVRHTPGGPYILVHPSRWDAFFMAVNQPDVFKHPEVQQILGLADYTQPAPPASD